MFFQVLTSEIFDTFVYEKFKNEVQLGSTFYGLKNLIVWLPLMTLRLCPRWSISSNCLRSSSSAFTLSISVTLSAFESWNFMSNCPVSIDGEKYKTIIEANFLNFDCSFIIYFYTINWLYDEWHAHCLNFRFPAETWLCVVPVFNIYEHRIRNVFFLKFHWLFGFNSFLNIKIS